MCTKTKTSFGCGCKFKDTDPCGEQDCNQIDRYAFLKEGDCQVCKSGGETVTRGRDGRGRYARQMQRTRDTDHHTPSTPTRQNRPTNIDVTGGRGPWAPQTRAEKPWGSPIRKVADHAWLSEHEDRMNDLQDKTEKLSLSSKSSRDVSPRESRGRVSEIVDGDEASCMAPRPFKETRAQTLPYEIQTIDDDSDRYYRRHRRHRKNSSHNSSDSMPQYVESPMPTHSYVTTKTIVPQADYDFYTPIETRSQRKRHGTKTEPCYTRSYTYESPICGSPVSGGYFYDQYEMIQPQQYNYVHPRSYREY